MEVSSVMGVPSMYWDTADSPLESSQQAAPTISELLLALEALSLLRQPGVEVSCRPGDLRWGT